MDLSTSYPFYTGVKMSRDLNVRHLNGRYLNGVT